MAFAALIAGGMITIGGNAASAQNLIKKYQRPEKMMVQKRTSDVTLRMPQMEESYGWDGVEWILNTKSAMKYDGSMLTEMMSDIYSEGSVVFSIRDRYKYNGNGMVTECVSEETYDEGYSWDKSLREVKDYDAERKDALILDEFYFWDSASGTWYLDDECEEGFYIELQRDDYGRVEKSTRWLNSNKSIALVSQQFKYDIAEQPGQTGGAIGMTWCAMNDNYELVPAYVYENMTWQESDKQYVSINPSIYYPFDGDANNKLTGYNIYAANADGTKGDLDAGYKSAYDENGRLYYVEINFGDGGQYQCVYKFDQDENGSYEYNEIRSGDFDGSGSIDFPAEYLMGTTVVTCNSHGDIIKEEMYDVDATLQKVLREGYGYEMTYNEDDLLTELTLTYYTTLVEGGSWENLNKYVYSDFTDGTSTGMISAEKGQAGVSLVNNTLYFENARGAHYIVTDMSGKTCARGIVNADKVSVNNLPDGMYIVKIAGRNANNAVKLIKK